MIVRRVERILLVQRILPAYRKELLISLTEIAKQDWTVAADPVSDGGIAVFDGTTLRRFIPLSRISVGTVYYLRGLGWPWSSDFDAIVMPGDLHCLNALWFGVCGRLRRGPPLILWAKDDSSAARPLRARMKRVLFRLARGVMFYSLREESKLWGRSEVHVVGNSVGMTFVDRTVADGGEPTKRAVTVVCVSRLMARRQLDVLIRASAARRVPVDLIIVGEGEVRMALEKLAGELGVNAEFLGAVYDPATLAGVYARADLVVIPGAAGLAVTQALAHGVPVIVSRDPENGPEANAVIDGLNGDHFEAGSAEGLNAAIDRVRAAISDGRISRDVCTGSVSEYTAPAHAKRMSRAVQTIIC